MKNKKLVNFLFEAATLKRLQRTGWQILGENRESIAEHSYLVCVISFVLAKELKADLATVLTMSLFHDFTEARIGDVYKLADLYVKVDVTKATNDAFTSLPQKNELISIIKEYENEKTQEARIVHDADTLALCLELKQLVENGNTNAGEWLDANLERLKLDPSKKLGKMIKSANSQDWWKEERNKLHKSFRG